MGEPRKLCDGCYYFQHKRQLCFASDRCMIARVLSCSDYQPIEVEVKRRSDGIFVFEENGT